MKSIIRKYIPLSILKKMRRICYYPLDVVDSLAGKRGDLEPSRGLSRYIGAGDFKSVGKTYLGYFTELVKLQKNAIVLDVGCGIGRMAVPLAGYLDPDGAYEGFDVVPEGISWCRKNITKKYPNFHFQLVDLYNGQYNPKGRYRDSEFTFPFGDEHFDFIFLGSIFTHMRPGGVENYLGEISRVLKNNGKCLITFFLLNDESVELMEKKAGTLDFKFDAGGCRVIDSRNPERAIAYQEGWVRNLYDKNNLSIEEPVRYGSWCGRNEFLSYQDIVIAVKL